MSHKQFDQFSEQLSKLHDYEKLPETLRARISQSDLDTLILALLIDEKLYASIKSLKPNDALRLDKAQTGLARTVCIVRAPDGEYQCILETENLDAKNKIIPVECFDGLDKKGTTAWRLDGSQGPTQYASLYVKLPGRNPRSKSAQLVIDKIKKEIAFGWELPENDFILKSILGPVYSTDEGNFISIYSPYGIRLDDVDQVISAQEHQEITLKVLQALDFLHEQGYIHQDIKPANVLVFIGPHRQISVKLIDFDTTVKTGANGEIVHATVGYESPEIALAMADPTMRDHQSYEAVYDEDGKTFAKRCADLKAQAYHAADKKSKLKALMVEFQKPHPKNDIWAAGVMLFEFLNKGAAPTALPADPCLRGMLTPDRENRFNAKQALEAWTGTLKAGPREQEKRSFLPMFRGHPFMKEVTTYAQSAVNSLKKLFS